MANAETTVTAELIQQEEVRSCLTREALADVDAGRVVDHTAVQTWAASLGTSGPRPVTR